MKPALLIDNYDSFTYTLKRYINELGVEMDIIKNDDACLNTFDIKAYQFMLISPGPGRPENAGLSLSIIKKHLGEIPLLGICLGHQCLALTLGAEISKANEIVHGYTSIITHNYDPLFNKIPQYFKATRYHSLSVKTHSLSEDFAITAWADNEIMGIKHRNFLAYGVQFHPEALLTEYGHQLLANFIDLVKASQKV